MYIEATESLSLQQLQNWLQQVILPGTVQVGQSLAKEKSGLNPGTLVHSSSRLTAGQHIAIYRQSYIARLRECMKNQFGALAYALGPELFQMFADQYLDVYPSESYTLNTLGQHFARFLQDTRPDADSDEKESWPDFMIELAAFEYGLSVIFDMAADTDEVTMAVDTPDNLLKPSPTLHLFHHRFPIRDYYLAYNQKADPELPFPQESYCAFVRQQYRLALYDIKPAQYYFLKAVLARKSINEAKQYLSDFLGHPLDKVEDVWQVWKGNFIASGFFHARYDPV